MKNSLKWVPYDDDGMLNWTVATYPELQQPNPWGRYQVTEWLPNDEFEATLRYHSYDRGRSKFLTWWKDVETGLLYPLILSELDRQLSKGTGIDSTITSVWKAIKRGQNYGLEEVSE